MVVKSSGGSGGPRDLAARVIERVLKQDAFAAAALQAELSRAAQLEPRDRALATELVYGTLRVLPWLRAELGRFAPRGLGSLDARVMARLTVAAYQLYFTRVPAFAAVSEAVDAVRSERGARLAGFANALLRKVATRAGTLGEEARSRAAVESLPPWLRRALGRALGPEGADAFLRATGGPPAVALRVEHEGERDAWLARLRAAAPHATFAPGSISPRAILARGGGRPQDLPGWAEGAWTVQEEGSQVAALALGVRQGEAVLDACAGRGNKTSVLARAAGATGSVDACDTSPAKLAQLAAELARLGLRARATYGVDWTVGSGEVQGLYDRILVDAPCTGTGTLRRRPEIALRLREDDLLETPRAQLAIAVRAASHLAPGGTLLYVVCSVLREEGEDVVDALLRERPELAPAPLEAPEMRAIAGDAPCIRLLPHVHGTDGYFVARLVSTR